LPLELRISRGMVAVYKQQPIESKEFKDIITASLNFEKVVSLKLAKEPEFLEKMVVTFADKYGANAPAGDKDELEYNAQLTPELASRVVKMAAAFKAAVDVETAAARDQRKKAIVALIAKKPELVKPIRDYVASEQIKQSRQRVHELLKAASN
jgi:hypothetical protein